jgi:CDP-6-deoxy-D-xylo-4-hexulose-3-dehydrase
MTSWPLMRNNIERSDLDAVIEHLQQEDPKLTHGPYVQSFEQAWSKWLGVDFSVMVNSGASANDLTMLALHEKTGGGEIIVPPLTWVSDIASVLHAGFIPKFVDINIENLSFNLEKLKTAINKNTRAIFLTHVLGINGVNQELLDIAQENGILLIEDVCESHGAKWETLKAGSIGFASNFSFYYAHHMTTIEGGMVSTNNPEFYDKVQMMRSHGMVRESKSEVTKSNYKESYPDLNPDFIFAHIAHNMRPTEIGGILGLSQLPRLDHNVELRTKNFKLFLDNLNTAKFHSELLFDGSSNYAFPIIMREPSIVKRDAIEEAFKNHGIEFRRGLSGGGNQVRQPYLAKHGLFYKPEDFPVADHIHFFSWYVGNYPSLESNKILELCRLLDATI